SEFGHFLHRGGGFCGCPASVAVDVQVDVVAECFAQCAYHGDVEVDRSAAHFHFEGGDAVVVAHALCFVDDGGGLVEAEYVAYARAVGGAAVEIGHREVECASEGVAEGHVEGGFGGGVADGAGEVV